MLSCDLIGMHLVNLKASQ